MSLELKAEIPPLREDPSGILRVGSSRVSLESVITSFQQGATPEQIREEYPSLDLADVYDVIAYYLRHRAEVERYLREQRQATDDMMDRLQREFPQAKLRDNLTNRLER